mmetsp:Transcript_62652/g.180188  ORF Transcript_62652/g.180188 Transcript_62652/m.180188 type:complete len:208 (+) Transcript_62652:1342-1965(+)
MGEDALAVVLGLAGEGKAAVDDLRDLLEAEALREHRLELREQDLLATARASTSFASAVIRALDRPEGGASSVDILHADRIEHLPQQGRAVVQLHGVGVKTLEHGLVAEAQLQVLQDDLRYPLLLRGRCAPRELQELRALLGGIGRVVDAVQRDVDVADRQGGRSRLHRGPRFGHGEEHGGEVAGGAAVALLEGGVLPAQQPLSLGLW